LKAGILYADRISTVSRSYAQEILTPRFGHGMDGILGTRRDSLAAIPNGVDTELWDPATDVLIARRFSAADLRGKAECKRELQLSFGLPVDRFAPIIAIGSRITHQKMADVALAALPRILEQHPRAQVIVLGCGERVYEEGFRALAARYRQRVGIFIGYDEERAHALHAGADLLLHGTRFEPFGLTPLYAMRYGTLPIASRVGGMIDSIADAGEDGKPAAGASGFLFDGEASGDMAQAVSRALALYEQPNAWHAVQRNAMAADFSWNGPAGQYIDLYRQLAPDFRPRPLPSAGQEPAADEEAVVLAPPPAVPAGASAACIPV
jgi:starch synthase